MPNFIVERCFCECLGNLTGIANWFLVIHKYFQASNPAKVIQHHNQHILAARFCRKVAAWVSDMFWNFYLGKNNKIANNSTTMKARENVSLDLESLEFEFLKVLQSIKTIKFNFINLSTDFQWQPGNLGVERSSFQIIRIWQLFLPSDRK